METMQLTTEKRTGSGKKAAKGHRREGKVPCIMYGVGKPEKLLVDSLTLFKALSGESNTRVILELDVDGKKHNAILRELQHHPISDILLHADFLEIDLNKPLKGKLPINLVGESVGVKMNGGQLSLHLRLLSVECLPKDMPSSVELDISKLDIGDSLNVGNIQVVPGMTIKDSDDSQVVSVVMAKVVEEEKPAEDEAEGEATAGAEAETGKASPAQKTEDK